MSVALRRSLMNVSRTSGGLEERKKTTEWPKGEKKATTTTERKTEWRDID